MNGAESFETLEVQPYYAQVHLRTFRQQTQMDRDQDGGHLPSTFYHKESTFQKVQGRTQVPDQKFSSGQKFGGRPTNGFKSSRPTLDTVYELHHFGDDSRGTDDLLDDEGNAELFARGSYDSTPTRYQPSEVSVAQSQQPTLEVGSHNATGFPPHLHSQINRHSAENGKNRKSIIQEEKSGYEFEAPVIYAYLHDDDGLSDMAEATSELTDETSLPVSSRKSKSNHNFAKSSGVQDQYSLGQENSSKSQRNSQTSDNSHTMDLIQQERDSPHHRRVSI